MQSIWEFYENMNEIVYASDVDTYEIVYMNRKARERHGIQSIEEVKGRKCYEVLQDCSSPCATCTNRQLKTGYYEEWKYYNPIFKKTYELKDTMIEEDGRRYRVELAIDVTAQEEQKETLRGYSVNETIINEGLRLSLSSSDPEESIALLLEYLGQSLKCDRVFIFEKAQGEYFDNTYEWCAQGVTQQKAHRKSLTVADLKIWMERFKTGQNVVIRDIEKLKTADPVVYDDLLPLDIHSLVAGPLVSNEEIIGFCGVDNPPERMVKNISRMFQILGHFIVSMLKRRDLVRRLENLSYYDQLTGCGNRHKLEEYIASRNPERSIGVICGDITGLKLVNDTQGHQAGDELLVRACRCLRKIFPDYEIFRTGGDEFLILCDGITQAKLTQRTERLRQSLEEQSVVMALGAVWRPDGTDDMDELQREADAFMYEDKRAYYASQDRRTQK
jgi:diguanylate cyclase (GGDEF)-like protein